MRGRRIAGWVRFAGGALGDEADVWAWVDRSVTFASTLPPAG